MPRKIIAGGAWEERVAAVNAARLASGDRRRAPSRRRRNTTACCGAAIIYYDQARRRFEPWSGVGAAPPLAWCDKCQRRV